MRERIVRAAARGGSVLAEITGDAAALALFLLAVAALGAVSIVLGLSGFFASGIERLAAGWRRRHAGTVPWPGLRRRCA